ncbi:ROK family protein [Lacrimispora sp.]|uniref:ROK family protein n=1 Tax=Lacrimispora sp. TaxID=2719234 RepID=UPI0028A7F857|nr:ROK family protein [Lacrimispora sp.]
MEYCLGIDIGGTFIKYALADETYNIVDRWKAKTKRFDSIHEFYDYICSNIKDLSSIKHIGVSAPGLIDEYSNVKSYAAANVCIMKESNVNFEIGKRTNRKVATINDAKAAGLCELKMGNAKGSSSSAFLIIGTGTGGCLCDEKGVIYGKDGYAGEFHHLPFMNFKTGILDRQGDYSAMTALIKIYNIKSASEDKAIYGNEVCDKYLNGDRIAIEAVDEWINNISIQLLTITVFYNPEIICIGGGISEEAWFIEAVREKFQSACKSFFKGEEFITTKIDKCSYNNDSNLLGAIINVNEMLK